MTVVAKFGGTSVANYQAMQRCARLILANPQIRLVIVSASSGVTNLLVELTKEGLTAHKQQACLQQIAEIQWAILSQLQAAKAVGSELTALLAKIAELSDQLMQQRDLAVIDHLLAHGELCSSLLFTAVLNELGGAAVNFDSRRVLKTNSHFGQAEPDIALIAEQAQQELAPLLSEQIAVAQGFIGADPQGLTTTLGRGGSDYSAALFAEGLQASAVEIWTDVAGIYTTDPRITSQAKVLQEISFNEAAEMATFGAKVLHPATILPAVRQNISVFVGSSLAPEQGGTWIRPEVQQPPLYRAIALRRQQTLLNLHSLKMLHAQGFLAQIFTTLAKHHLSVDLITTSEVNVSLTLDKAGSESAGGQLLTEALLQELSQHCRVEVEEQLALVAVIGNGIASTAGVCQRLFNTLADFNVRMVCQGASPHNLCVLVEDSQASAVVQALHQELFESFAASALSA